MQKLQVELKNAPADASQVCCTANHELNRDQSLSAQGMENTTMIWRTASPLPEVKGIQPEVK